MFLRWKKECDGDLSVVCPEGMCVFVATQAHQMGAALSSPVAISPLKAVLFLHWGGCSHQQKPKGRGPKPIVRTALSGAAWNPNPLRSEHL